jgi:putative restriction endonuclease
MAKAVFTTKVIPSYDDRPEERYHFPKTYLNQARAAVGDHIIYYEPRRSSSEDSSRGGRRAYFATARLDDVVEDRTTPDHFYALISPLSYLDFDRPVPFREGAAYFETALQKSDGTTNKGAFGRAIRTIPDREFDLILRAGFARELVAPDQGTDSITTQQFDDIAQREFVRPVIEMTVSRPFRDRAFMHAVRSAYANKCAVSGMRLINGGGRPEVQAAHIKPVDRMGPDSVRNGLALSGTLHWLFDRGLISVSDTYDILISKKLARDEVQRLVNAEKN